MIVRQAQFKQWGTVQWKVLTWADHKRFQDSTNFKSPMAVSNDIYRACIVNGPNVQDATAGLVEFVVKDIFTQSAFTGNYNILQEKLNEKRKAIENDFLLSARAVISGIFGYKFEEIDSWDEETFLLRLAQAEFVAGKPLGLGDPRQEVKPKKEIVKPDKLKRELTESQKLVLNRMNEK